MFQTNYEMCNYWLKVAFTAFRKKILQYNIYNFTEVIELLLFGNITCTHAYQVINCIWLKLNQLKNIFEKFDKIEILCDNLIVFNIIF